MYAKLKTDGQIQLAPKVLSVTYSNPTEEQLEFAGYRKVIETDPPEHNLETQCTESHYIEDGDCIRQVWDVIDLPVEETQEEVTE